MFIKIKLLLS